MSQRPHLEQARENATRTYDRRRARSAADTLAQIPPNRWDDHTRQVIATLALTSGRSPIDVELDKMDEPPIAARCRRLDHRHMGFHTTIACEPIREGGPSHPCERGHWHGTASLARACTDLDGHIPAPVTWQDPENPYANEPSPRVPVVLETHIGHALGTPCTADCVISSTGTPHNADLCKDPDCGLHPGTWSRPSSMHDNGDYHA